MKAYYVTFRSVTFAQRAQARLAAEGIACTLRRTPKWMEKQGCGYCLQLQVPFGAAAVEILHRERMEFRKIYLEKGDSSMEEVWL